MLDAPPPVPPDTSRRGAPQRLPSPSGAVTPVPGPNTLAGNAQAIARLVNLLDAADVPITTTQRASVADALKGANEALARWAALRR